MVFRFFFCFLLLLLGSVFGFFFFLVLSLGSFFGWVFLCSVLSLSLFVLSLDSFFWLGFPGFSSFFLFFFFVTGFSEFGY